MKCYTQIYARNSLEAVETYCRAFGAEPTLEMFNEARTKYEHCELAVDIMKSRNGRTYADDGAHL